MRSTERRWRRQRQQARAKARWLGALRRAAATGRANPIAHRRYIAWQEKFLDDSSKIRLIRAANQVGKTTAMIDDMLGFIRGTRHKEQRARGPVNVILVSESEEQMSQEGAILEKLFAALNPGEIAEGIHLIRGKGLRGCGDGKAIPFVSGPGAGSVIRIRTFGQKPGTFAGSTVHAIYIDEPCPEAAYSELLPRIKRHRGLMALSFTPTPDMPDMTWLRKLVEEGVVKEHHVCLTEENTWMKGCKSPIYEKAYIDQWRLETPKIAQAMRFEASWDPVVVDRWVDGFEAGSHVRAFSVADVQRYVASLPPRADGQPREVYVFVGTDHGLVPGKQRSELVLVADPGVRAEMRVWFLDEVAEEDVSDSATDARWILAMLARHGLQYESVDDWIGDRSTGDGKGAVAKTNDALRVQLLHHAGITSRDRRAKMIMTPKKGQGSVFHGAALLHELFVTGRALVHPNCEAFIEALTKFRGGWREPCKDAFDAGRYPVERAALWQRTVPVRANVWGRS